MNILFTLNAHFYRWTSTIYGLLVIQIFILDFHYLIDVITIY